MIEQVFNSLVDNTARFGVNNIFLGSPAAPVEFHGEYEEEYLRFIDSRTEVFWESRLFITSDILRLAIGACL